MASSLNESSRSEDHTAKRRTPSYSEVLGNELVTIRIGSQQKTVMIHKNLLIRDSQYFRTSLGSGSPSGSSIAELRLPDEDADTVDAYVRWLYGSGSTRSGEYLSLSPTVCLKLYRFAERILHTNLADYVMDGIRSSWHVPDWQTIVDYWRKSTVSSGPMRLCLIHKIADRLAYDNDHALQPLVGPLPDTYFAGDDCPAPLLIEVHRVLQTLLPHDRTPFPPRSGSPKWCDWHLHERDGMCDKRGETIERYYEARFMKPPPDPQGDTTSSSSGNGNGNGNGDDSGNGGNGGSSGEGEGGNGETSISPSA